MSLFPNLNGLGAKDVRTLLKQAGFEGKKIAESGYQRFKHSDGSEIWVNWKTGRITRHPAPKYGENGARVNKGQRLKSDGSEIPRNVKHEKHPPETIKTDKTDKTE